MTDTIDYCVHEMVRDNCAICQPKSQPIFWDALFEGTCPVCQRPIMVGDRVKWNTAGTATVHARHGRD